MGKMEQDFEPPIHARPVPPDVSTAREGWDVSVARLEAQIGPRIEAGIQACQLALDALADLHRKLADETDIDLSGETRWVALWEMSGRCIALGNALLEQLRAGYTTETAGTARVLVEALNLALAFVEGDEQVVRRWLRGKQVGTKEAAAEANRLYELIVREMAEQGQPLEQHPEYLRQLPGAADLGIPTEGGAAGIIKYTSGRVYGELSSAVHNRRAAVRASSETTLRSFAYRAHPNPRLRAHWVEQGSGHIERTLLDVGTCLAKIFGIDVVRPVVMAHVAGIHAMRTE